MLHPHQIYPFTLMLGSIVIASYLILSDVFGFHSWLLVLAKELGFAYVVAAVLGFSIEAYNRWRDHLRQDVVSDRLNDLTNAIGSIISEQTNLVAKDLGSKVAVDVLGAVYRRTIPSKILDATVKHVLGAERIRHSYYITVQVQRLSEYLEESFGAYEDESARERDRHRVALVYSSSWIDENVGPSERDVEVAAQSICEGPEIEGITGIQYFRVFRNVGTAFQHDLVRKDYREARQDSRQEGGLDGLVVQSKVTSQRTDTIVRIPKVAPREKFGVELIRVSVQDLEDEHVAMCMYSSAEAQLKVRSAPDLDVTVTSIHSDDAVELPREVSWHDRERRWRLTSALLPCQGFVLNWRPASPRSKERPPQSLS